jgi:hypothetical protein
MAAVLLAGALAYGRTRGAPDLETPAREIFPRAASIALRQGVLHVYDGEEALIGWAGTGSAAGYGGPTLLLAGIDTLGQVVGIRVIEQRETPIFWRMVRSSDYFDALSGSHFEDVSYEYEDVVGATGATRSADAIVLSVRRAVAEVAGTAFDLRLPLPRRPFEFGLLEIVILALFAAGFAARRLRGTVRGRVRWGAQITGLIVLGFWKDSPITLAKITALLSGYLPDIRVGLAVYLLLAGFLLTSIFYGRNLYCLFACPFGAAQRVVGYIGGMRLKLPPRSVRFMERVRNVVVFAALFAAFLTLRPVLAGYEPFAALFSLHGTTLQWLLLFLVLVTSLVVYTPWCNFFCPMRTFEVAIQDGKRWIRGGRPDTNQEVPE